MPFGWTLSYLPFEMLGFPQGSQLLSVALFLILFSATVRTLRDHGIAGPAVLGASLMLLHPAVVRAFSESGADGYALIAIFTIVVLLMRLPRLGARAAALLGFASWIGMQSRYQLVAARPSLRARWCRCEGSMSGCTRAGCGGNTGRRKSTC